MKKLLITAILIALPISVFAASQAPSLRGGGNCAIGQQCTYQVGFYSETGTIYITKMAPNQSYVCKVAHSGGPFQAKDVTPGSGVKTSLNNGGEVDNIFTISTGDSDAPSLSFKFKNTSFSIGNISFQCNSDLTH